MIIAESADTILELQAEVEEQKDEARGLRGTIVSLNEEVEVLSKQRAKLAGECEQYALQVRELVQSSGAEEAEAARVRTLKTQVDKLGRELSTREEDNRSLRVS